MPLEPADPEHHFAGSCQAERSPVPPITLSAWTAGSKELSFFMNQNSMGLYGNAWDRLKLPQERL